MKKCLVLDLDNTLWGGIIGEDGIDGIALSVKAPGNSFLAFQQALVDHYDRGIILAINSRNNPDDAWNVIRNHPNQLLKEHHFAAARINWQDKATNMRELSKELNIGLDSMVFLDDDQTNRALVRSLIPEVEVPELPTDPKDYTRFLNTLPYFTGMVITDEDKMRGNLYVTERLRKEEEKQHKTKEDFLKGLSLELFVYKNDDSCIARLAQLTEKTNQFNIAKHPYTEEELTGFISNPMYEVYHGRLQDSFGDYGVVIFAIVAKNESIWHIETFLMSCRVFGRGVEDALFCRILEDAKKAGAKEVTISYQESEKNIPAKEFIDANFTNLSHTLGGGKETSPLWIHVHTYETI
jgi:FkbH-like protein